MFVVSDKRGEQQARKLQNRDGPISFGCVLRRPTPTNSSGGLSLLWFFFFFFFFAFCGVGG